MSVSMFMAISPINFKTFHLKKVNLIVLDGKSRDLPSRSNLSRALWISVPNFMGILPIVVGIFQSGSKKWWTNHWTDIAIPRDATLAC